MVYYNYDIIWYTIIHTIGLGAEGLGFGAGGQFTKLHQDVSLLPSQGPRLGGTCNM